MAPTLPMRSLGQQGLKASAQGLGCMGMSTAYKDKASPVTDEESIATIHKALELGVTFLDTSDMYGPFTNEELVGKALKGKREQYTLATKFGLVPHADGKGADVDGSSQHVRAACEASLKRLQTDYIDLYYQHRVDRKVGIETTVREMKKLVEEGKVKYLGLSEATSDEIRRAHAIHPISAVQLEWSLWTRNAEADVIPTCRELGIGIVAYGPLGRGFLTGTVRSIKDLHETDWRVVRMPRFQGENLEKNIKLVEKVDQVAKAKWVEPGQLALAWVHSQGDDVFPIPGTKRIKYLEQNAAAFHMKLTAEEKLQLEAVFASDQVSGERYTEAMKKIAHEGGQ
ncbi:hypothetical protein WJX82_009067 [Trebouxia sp. C0006]